jgi:hypothetical protein
METTKEKHATHTPGPWYTYQSHKDVNRHIACKDGKSIAKEVHHANARLIAAAPEMYEMCKLLEECMENLDGRDGWDASYELAKVREVLAKVEGGEG